jgi:DNA polymerase-3 subunit delta
VPIVLVAGENASYVELEAYEVLTELTRETEAVVPERLDASEVPYDRLLEAVLSTGLFPGERTLVVRRLEALPRARLAEFLEGAAEADFLKVVGILVAKEAGQLKAPSPKIEALARAGRFRLVPVRTPSTLKDKSEFVLRQAARLGVALEDGAVTLLIEHLGDELHRAGRVLELARASRVRAVHEPDLPGQGARLGVEDVEPYLGDAGQVSMFKVLDALDAGDAARAIEYGLRSVVDKGDAFKLLGILFSAYTASLRIAEGRGPGEEGRSSYAARAARDRALRLGPLHLGRALELVARADLDLKGASGLPQEAVLEVLLARLAQLARLARSPAGEAKKAPIPPGWKRPQRPGGR